MTFGKGKQKEPWSKGLTAETDERIKKMIQKREETKNKRKAEGRKYIFGIAKLSMENPEIVKGKNNPFYGKHQSEGVKNIVRNRCKGRTYEELYGKERATILRAIQRNNKPNLGKKFPKDKYPKFGWRTSRKNQIFPVKDTPIELKIQNYLKILHVQFVTHYYISEITHSYQCDILIPSTKTIIETDGCYWHGCPVCFKKMNKWQKEQIEEDSIRTKELQEKGYKMIRLWEHDIKKMELNELKEQIIW